MEIPLPKLLSAFPDLLVFGVFGVVLLRVVLGFLFVRFGYVKLWGNRDEYEQTYASVLPKSGNYILVSIAWIELLGGILLIIGALTQIVALVFAGLMLTATLLKIKNASYFRNDPEFYFILFVVSVALLFLGPGTYAIDLPF